MPTVTEVGPIAKMLGHILPGKPVRYEALTIIPLLAPMLAEPDWRTMAEGGNHVQITEVDERAPPPPQSRAHIKTAGAAIVAGK